MRAKTFAFFSLILLYSYTVAAEVQIDFWYGKEQHFGQLGHPQRWVNVLGNASPSTKIASAVWSLNNSPQRRLSIGSDPWRLAKPGDFNVEIDRTELKAGVNTITVKVTDNDGNSTEATLRLTYINDGRKWPLPYRINWQEVDRLEDVAQVIDGKWILTKNGVRTAERYYDRAVAIGDDSWSNYEVSTTVTFHGFTPRLTPPNMTDVTHAAIATRWPGHDVDEHQPHQKWYPLGATAEFILSDELDQCRWRIFDRVVGKKSFMKRLLDYVFNNNEQYRVESKRHRVIELNKTYGMKHRVMTLDNGRTQYAVKLWPADESEPDAWDLVRLESNDLPSGSALLIAHHADVTFGNVSVEPIKTPY
jgi:hypothetical protein